MAETILCATNGLLTKEADDDQIRTLLAQPESVLWLDINDPGQEDFRRLEQVFQFHALAIEDISHNDKRPKIEVYDTYYFLIFYSVVATQATEQRFQFQPLYLFVGNNYLVSVHKGMLTQIEETMRRWRDPNIPPGNRIGSLLHALLDTIVDDYFPVIDAISDETDEIEDEIFERFEHSSIQSIFTLKRELLKLRRAIAPERDVLNVLMRRDLPILRGRDIAYIQDVYDHVIRVADAIDSYRDLLSSALDSYLSVEASRQNKILKVLTIASIILMLNALIAGIYGMNFEFMPELHWLYGYPMALGLMAGISLALILVFRRLRWI